ncbi:MAG TPA: KpsF/GutQ family sugar-phosphate isomerase [Vicinamibacteria bacterium]|nr:KpsF/GutQ family sugar-phosphate isomerase [Vicinamibacteria bacterium]
MTREIARRVLEIEADSIKKLIDRLDESFERAVDLVSSCRGRVVVTGMGKSGIIGRKIAATLNSTGTPSLYLNPAEALHGDLGMVVSGDVVVLLSNSGRTRELVALVEPIKRLSVPLIALLGNRDSTLGEAADVVLDVSVEEEACPMGLAPTASTTASLALGDALAMSVLEKKGFGADDFRTLHPNGQLGFKLMRVEDAMHRGDDIPKVRTDALMRDAIYEMSRKGLGVTSVVDGDDRLVGVISDGDLRRQLERDERLLTRTASDCMTKNPVTVPAKEAATAALALMEKRRITSLMVPDEEGRIVGVLHLHDLWRLSEYF